MKQVLQRRSLIGIIKLPEDAQQQCMLGQLIISTFFYEKINISIITESRANWHHRDPEATLRPDQINRCFSHVAF